MYGLKSFSIACRYIIDGVSTREALPELPLWHSAIFKSDKRLTYNCPARIAKGIVKIKHLSDLNHRPLPNLRALIGPTWRGIYTKEVDNFLTVPITDWSIPSVWSEAWTKASTLRRLAPDPHTTSRRSPAVWQAFWRA